MPTHENDSELTRASILLPCATARVGPALTGARADGFVGDRVLGLPRGLKSGRMRRQGRRERGARSAESYLAVKSSMCPLIMSKDNIDHDSL